MKRNLVSETSDLSEKAGLWNSVIGDGERIFDDSIKLTDEQMEQIRIYDEERKKLVEECTARGHLHPVYRGMESCGKMITVSMYCKDCKVTYRRSPTDKEYRGFHNRMNRVVD